MSAVSERGLAELRRFGWTLGPEFERRYMTDAWVFNLVNALEAVAAERDAALERDGELEAGLTACADELDGWGWGDFHYGEQPQEQRVRDAVAAARALVTHAPTGRESDDDQ